MMNTQRLERTLKALANARRLNIIKLLKSQKELPVGEIAEHLKLSLRSTSRHLTLLAAADLLEREQRSHQVFYRRSSNFAGLRKEIASLFQIR